MAIRTQNSDLLSRIFEGWGLALPKECPVQLPANPALSAATPAAATILTVASSVYVTAPTIIAACGAIMFKSQVTDRGVYNFGIRTLATTKADIIDQISRKLSQNTPVSQNPDELLEKITGELSKRYGWKHQISSDVASQWFALVVTGQHIPSDFPFQDKPNQPLTLSPALPPLLPEPGKLFGQAQVFLSSSEPAAEPPANDNNPDAIAPEEDIFEEDIYKAKPEKVAKLSDRNKVKWTIAIADEAERLYFDTIEKIKNSKDKDELAKILKEARNKVKILDGLKPAADDPLYNLIIDKFRASYAHALASVGRSSELGEIKLKRQMPLQEVKDLVSHMMILKKDLPIPESSESRSAKVTRRELAIIFLEWLEKGSSQKETNGNQISYVLNPDQDKFLYEVLNRDASSTGISSNWPPDRAKDAGLDEILKFLDWNITIISYADGKTQVLVTIK